MRQLTAPEDISQRSEIASELTLLFLCTRLPTEPMESEPLRVADSSEECSHELLESVDELRVVLETGADPVSVRTFDASEFRKATDPNPGLSKIDDGSEIVISSLETSMTRWRIVRRSVGVFARGILTETVSISSRFMSGISAENSPVSVEDGAKGNLVQLTNSRVRRYVVRC